MHAHYRTLIRKNFVSLLKGKTIAGDNVFDSRLYPMEHTSLPGIIIFTDNEEVTTSTIGYPRLQERILRVSVECYFKATNEVNAQSDILALQVEKAILSTPNLVGLYKSWKLESTETKLNSDGDKPCVVLTLMFRVSYTTKEGNPSNIK